MNVFAFQTVTAVVIATASFRHLRPDYVLSGLSSLGVPGVPWHTQYLADHLTLFQPGGTDYTHLITTGTPGFSDLPTALYLSPAICFYSDWL